MKKKERKNYLSNYDPPHKPAPAHTHTYGAKLWGFVDFKICYVWIFYFLLL